MLFRFLTKSFPSPICEQAFHCPAFAHGGGGGYHFRKGRPHKQTEPMTIHLFTKTKQEIPFETVTNTSFIFWQNLV